MSAKDNLQLARKYEWNASMARLQGNTKEADRYESMARMSMIDVGIDMTSNVPTLPRKNMNTASFTRRATTKEDLKNPNYWIGWAIAVVLIGGSALISCFM